MGNCFSCQNCCCFGRRTLSFSLNYDILIDSLFEDAGRANDGGLYEPLLQENEREAVADLLRFLENRADSMFFEGEPLRALSTLSYSNNVDLQRSAALAFAEITERHVDEVDTAVLEPLLYLLRESPDIEVQRAASAALGNLAVNVANKLKIVRLGALDSLIRQMSSPNVEVQCNAVGCITNLATHEENKSAVARSGALIPLVKLARTTKDMRVQRNSSGALLNMTHSEENRKELVDAGAIPVLVSLLRSLDVDVVYYCTTSLSNLAVDAVNRKKLAQETRLVNELVDLMESSVLKIQCQAALALRNLASDELYQLEIVRHPRGLSRLLVLLGGATISSSVLQQSSSNNSVTKLIHPQLILAAVACIRNISIHPQNESKIIDAGFLKPLVELLGNDNEEIQCHAISALRNLAASTTGQSLDEKEDEIHARNKERIVESGALTKIQSLIDDAISQGNLTSGMALKVSWSVLSEMTACLAVLALSDKLKPILLKSGIIRSLLPLTVRGIPTEVQGNAAAALGNLATKAPDAKPFLDQWELICQYLERFMEPATLTSSSLSSAKPIQRQNSELEETSSTFQHIAVWTVLQFSEKEVLRARIRERKQLLDALRVVATTNHDDEVRQLLIRTASSLNLKI